MQPITIAQIPSPLEQYVISQIDHYRDESLRLGSREPLQAFQALVTTFQLVESKLGGLEHEVALDSLQKEFDKVQAEIINAVRQTWGNFWHFRKLAKAQAQQEQTLRAEALEHQDGLRQSIADLKNHDDEPWAREMGEALQGLAALKPMPIEMSSAWRVMSWSGLWVDSKLLAIYVKYLLGRARVFVSFHAFIFLAPILLLGIGYSIASKYVVALISAQAPNLVWLGTLALVASYALKKYIIDKKLKKLQKKVETSLYKPLSLQLFLARNISLAVNTLRSGRKAEKAAPSLGTV